MSIIKAGRHEVVVTTTGLQEKENGLTITVGFEDVDGNTITAYLYTSEKAWPYTEKKLQTLGWDPLQNGFRFEELNTEPSPIAGKAVQIVVADEEYDGKLRSKVQFINPPGGGVERLAPEEAKSVAARLRARLTGSGTAKAAMPEDKIPW
jgi:hypothetical protein